jgi:hypothetical protein
MFATSKGRGVKEILMHFMSVVKDPPLDEGVFLFSVFLFVLSSARTVHLKKPSIRHIQCLPCGG